MDWSRPGRLVKVRISDPRAVQFWDKHHLVSQELSKQLAAEPDCCRREGSLWDLVALYPRHEKWATGAPVFVGGPVVRSKDEIAARLHEFAEQAQFYFFCSR
jgi:hypothetical protein